MVAYIDFFLGGDEKRLDVASTIQKRFPMCIIFGGDGSYMAPYYLHSDTLLTNLLGQVLVLPTSSFFYLNTSFKDAFTNIPLQTYLFTNISLQNRNFHWCPSKTYFFYVYTLLLTTILLFKTSPDEFEVSYFKSEYFCEWVNFWGPYMSI